MQNIVEITDLNAPELQVYAHLTQAQLRARRAPEQAMFIAESPKVISHALDAGYQPVSFLMERKRISGAGAEILARCGEVPVYTGPPEVLEGLTGYRLTRGVLCAMRRRPLPSPEEVCRGARRVAVLEGLVDPTNVGAIFRSAAALGADGVLVAANCCDPLHRRAVRVSMGTVFQVPWTLLAPGVWPEEGGGLLRALGFETAAMALSRGAIPVDTPWLREIPRLALVFGPEGDGLPAKTLELCDHVVQIPMERGVDSLNVAAASAVAFWALRVREPEGRPREPQDWRE